MARFADLEIELTAQEGHEYKVSFRHKAAGSAAGDSPKGGLATIDPDALLTGEQYRIVEPKNYGHALTDCLFADSEVKASFAAVRARAQEAKAPLRIRLRIKDAPELHRVRWELLLDPGKDAFLFANPNLIFSRYPEAQDSLDVQIGPKSRLKALVMVANPSDLDPDKLAPIDVPQEMAVASESLGPIRSVTIPESDSESHATLENLIGQLKDNKFEIVYLVCHGLIKKSDEDEESLLYLEDENGELKLTDGRELEAEFGKLDSDHRPNLVILASCQSAGDDEGQALTALGPRLAQAGIPAVIAIQGSINIDTNKSFMSEFFHQLYQHGVIDEAVTEARWHVRERHDFWMPVLFMRLDDGRIWSGFSDKISFRLWPVLSKAIEKEKLVPILGTGLIEPIIGSLREISAGWAEDHHYPLFKHECDAVPQIAQFMSVEYGLDYTKTDLEDSLKEKLLDEHQTELEGLEEDASLDEIIDVLANKHRERVQQDAYNLLARLSLPIYITANITKVLETALAENGEKIPRTLISPWNEYVRRCYYGYPHGPEDEDCIDQKPYDFSFTMINSENPLVFHPFGRLDDPKSVVLTEDEYFEYLTGLRDKDNQSLLLKRYPVQKVHSGTLLFLGFHLVDWEFRVLLQTLLAFDGSKRLFTENKKHIAVIQLDQPNIMNPEGARDYLMRRLQKKWEIYMYVGSPEDFLAELQFFLPVELGGRNNE